MELPREDESRADSSAGAPATEIEITPAMLEAGTGALSLRDIHCRRILLGETGLRSYASRCSVGP